MKTPGESLTHKPAGPEETGKQPEGRAAVVGPIPPGEVRYEPHDVNAGPVARALVVLVVATVVVVAALIPLFTFLRARAQRADPPPPPMGAHEPGRLPPQPRLQTTPTEDLQVLRAEEARLLSEYGWVDEQRGIVRIPIEEAMRRIAAGGLPPVAPLPSASPATVAPGGPAPPAAPAGAAPAAASPAPPGPAATPSPRGHD